MYILASTDKKTNNVSFNITSKELAWLGLPVCDKPYGVCQVRRWDRFTWLFVTDGQRLHAVRLDQATELPQMQFAITRLIWETKFNKESEVTVQFDFESPAVYDDSEGGTGKRKVPMQYFGRDSEGRTTREIYLPETKLLKIQPEGIIPDIAKWDVDRRLFQSKQLEAALKGLDERVVLGTPSDNPSNLIVGPQPEFHLSNLPWFVIISAEQAELPLGEGDF